jgi:thymidylate synthase (FAD)
VQALGGPSVIGAWRKRPRTGWNKLTVARSVRIKGFEYVGEKMTYDIEVEGPYHNFIANGIVTHNSVNEVSTRYSIAIDSEQKTPHDQWRAQSKSSRQGSEGFLDARKGKELSAKEAELIAHARSVYEERLAAGVAREQARKDLPLSTYTEAYWKIDLHNLFHFLSLRMDDHAQLEIREYAKTMGYEIVRRWCPIAWEAFVDYRIETMNLTRLDVQIVAALGRGDAARAVALATEFGWLSRGEKGLRRNRERAELETKLERLNFPIPWKD